MFATFSHFCPSLTFAGKGWEPKIIAEPPKGLHFDGLLQNIKLGLKRMVVTNTLAYYDMVTIIAVNS